jgi:hypothetical protein
MFEAGLLEAEGTDGYYPRDAKLRSPRAFLVFCVLSLLVFFPVLTRPTGASPGAVAKVEPQTVSAGLFQTFNVSIVVADVQRLYGLEITLNWDPTILRVVKAEHRIGVEDYPGGILHKPVMVVRDNVSQDHGLYLVAAACLNPAGSFNGTGTVAQITFNVTSLGTCELLLEAELPSDAWQGQSQPIDHQTINGFFGKQPAQELDWRTLIAPAVVIVIILVLVVVIYLKKKR